MVQLVFFRYATMMTFELIILLSNVFEASEFDALILAWKEKVRHDFVIQRSDLYGTPKEINTCGGTFQAVETFA